MKQLAAEILNVLKENAPFRFLVNFISQLTPADFLGFAFAFVGLLVYVFVIWIFRPNKDRLVFEAPALLYIALLIWILTGMLGGFTSNFDQYHFPVILFLIGLSGCSYLACGVDHYFEVKKIENSSPHDQLEATKDFKQAIQERLKNQPATDKTLVIIAASGGGIQAAGWTVQVLTGLQDALGESFTQAIGLISSVSGGSVGTMFFLDQFTEKGFPPHEKFKKIFENATEDNLDAVGWGLAYPDLVRIWLPFLVDKYNDRGYAIEQDWKVGMAKPEATLATRREQIFQGQIPIPVFNATLVEDGRRFLISPMTFIKDKNQDASKRKALDFNTLFNESEIKDANKSSTDTSVYNLDVTTAARLSASFPYVSPIARNCPKFNFNYHVADGGYFDNSGMFTVVEWLDQYINIFSQELYIKKVLVIQINASPEIELPQKGREAGLGWFMEWLGPIIAVFKVRDSTQISRNFKEIELLEKLGEKENIKIKHFPITFPQGYNQPLSWKLTKEQKKNLGSGWGKFKESADFKKLKDFWEST